MDYSGGMDAIVSKTVAGFFANYKPRKYHKGQISNVYFYEADADVILKPATNFAIASPRLLL